MSDPLRTYVEALERLDADNIDSVLELVSDDIHFSDPFNNCRTRAMYRVVLADMFEKLEAVQFSVDHYAWSANSPARHALLKWTLSARLFGDPWSVGGCSSLEFDALGRITAHHDYWDAAAAVYERMPILGRVLAAIRRRISVE